MRVNAGGMMSEVKKKGAGGRPPIYRKEFVEQARKLCLLGATDEAIANFFEVSLSCIDKWKVAHPEFLRALKEGKQVADSLVADKLFNRALGYKHKELKVFNNQGEILTFECEKEYPPDTTAAIFWLKNRQPQLWRDRVEQKVVLSDDFDEVINSDD